MLEIGVPLIKTLASGDSAGGGRVRLEMPFSSGGYRLGKGELGLLRQAGSATR